jgi:hypothetical protein
MDRQMYHYATVTKALQELAEKGYTTDFNLEEERIKSNADDFTIQHIYRYEGESDPGDEATVYGIKTTSGENTENGAARMLLDMTIRDRAENQ